MLRKKASILCDFCQREYYSKKEMILHQYFHKDQDVEDLTSCLRSIDASYCLPKARRDISSEPCIRVTELFEEKFDDKGKPKPPTMLDRVEDMVSLSNKYPLRKPSAIVYSDISEDEGDEKENFERESNLRFENKRRQDSPLGVSSDPKKSVSSGSNKRQRVDRIPDINSCAQSQKKCDSKVEKAVFDSKDSPPKFDYFNQNRIAKVNPDFHNRSKNFISCSVKNSNLTQVAASDHSYSRKTPNTAPKSDIRYDSAFLKSVENATKDPLSHKHIPPNTAQSSGLFNDSKMNTSTYDPRLELNSSFNGDNTEFGRATCNNVASATAYSSRLNGTFDSESSVDQPEWRRNSYDVFFSPMQCFGMN